MVDFRLQDKQSLSRAEQSTDTAILFDSLVKDNEMGVDPEEDSHRRKSRPKPPKPSFFDRFKKKKELELYEDFDTDEDEDLDITPGWLRNRRVIHSDLELEIKSNKRLEKVPLRHGQTRGNKRSLAQFGQLAEPVVSCYMKCIFLSNAVSNVD